MISFGPDISISLLYYYIFVRESACFYCPNTSCNAGRDNKYIRMHSAGATEAMTIRFEYFVWCCFS